MLDVNLRNQFVLTQAIGAGMLERGSGRVIFTASLLSFQGGINVPGYTAAKSGIAGLVKALSNEWSARGVTVTDSSLLRNDGPGIWLDQSVYDVRIAGSDMIEQHDPEPVGERRRDQSPHALVTAEPVGEQHRLTGRQTRLGNVVADHDAHRQGQYALDYSPP